MQGANDGQDEHADADERDGCQQDDVTWREVQLGTPAAEDNRGVRMTILT